MGELIIRHWIPALLWQKRSASQTAHPCACASWVRFVAFRDSMGQAGLLAEHCSHRGTSLFYGRNEECGLRCIYHGWKYDIDGRVLETPAEPTGSTLKDKVRHTAYPCREAAGVVFAYMGPKERIPLLPNYEWMTLPAKSSLRHEVHSRLQLPARARRRM